MKRSLQRLGKSLMQAVAVMPLAALLIGIGYMIDQDWGSNSLVAAFLIKAGAAVLDHLGLIFAVAVAFGLAKDSHGAAALAGLISMLTMMLLLDKDFIFRVAYGDTMANLEKANALTDSHKFFYTAFGSINFKNVFVGILAGIIGGYSYNKFFQVKLPEFLAFFSGRRLVPIMASIISLVSVVVLYFAWPVIYVGLITFGKGLQGMGPLGAGIYAFFNRLLIPTGLHHALNQVFWQNLVGINDIPNFLNRAADTITNTYHPGMYQAGFFPIMMFGLPAAAVAMFSLAKPEKKQYAKSLFLAGALASFVTGVTEPIEFAFMFLAPGLYLAHAVLTGISVFLAAQFGWYAGFGFSAGLIDMFLSTSNPLAKNWYMLLVLGLVFAVIYFVLFKFAIQKLNLQTPGREEDDVTEGVILSKDTNYTEMARVILAGLGGKENISSIDHCITRLRLEVKDETLVDEKAIKRAKVAGVVRSSQKSVQVIIGPQVQAVHDEFVKLV